MEYKLKELVEKCKDGNHYAKGEMLKSLTPLVITSIKRYYIGNEEFSDLIQEGCMKILEVIESYDETTGVPFLGYVKVQLKYFYFNQRKKAKKEIFLHKQIDVGKSTLSFIDLLEDKGANIEENFLKKEDYKLLQQGLNVLTERQKQIIKFTYIDHLTMKQIAKDLGVNYQTVVKTKKRALKKLRGKYPKYYDK